MLQYRDTCCVPYRRYVTIETHISSLSNLYVQMDPLSATLQHNKADYHLARTFFKLPNLRCVISKLYVCKVAAFIIISAIPLIINSVYSD